MGTDDIHKKKQTGLFSFLIAHDQMQSRSQSPLPGPSHSHSNIMPSHTYSLSSTRSPASAVRVVPKLTA